jgi:predicted TIM-barrel enzyme
MITKLFGPKSKHDKSLPNTYEAKVPIMEGVDIYNYYMSDTICGLIEYLEKNEIKPDCVEIHELIQNEEKVIQQDFYISKEGDWLHKPELCRCLKDHYKGHISEGKCSFNDRDRKGIGP